MSNQKHLWAPWKMEYIKNKDSSQKLFSEKANESEDRENLILYRGEFCYIIMNYYPYNNGHLMVVPYDEVDSMEHLENDSLNEIMYLVKKSMTILKENLKCEGFNFGANIGSPAIVFYSVTTTGLTFDIFKSYFAYYLLAICHYNQIVDEKKDLGEIIKAKENTK